MLKINQEKCTKCGICAEVCPTSVLAISADGPVAANPDGCVACGHCVAVCPQAALDHSQAPLVNQVMLAGWDKPDAAAAETMLRFRRSVRCYQPKAVPRETMRDLLNIGRFAQTGGNTQGLSYIVVDDPALLRKISATIIDWFKEQASSVDWIRAYMEKALERHTGTKDLILRGAPALVIATAPTALPMGRDNSRIAFTYIELYAPYVGLGTCWMGFVEMCLNAKYAPLIDLLSVPDGRVAVGALAVGFPVYSYQRLVDRKPLQVDWR